MAEWPAPVDLLPPLLSGLTTTLQIAAGAAVLAAAAAIGAGLARAGQQRWLRLLAGTYIELFRGTSALVQLFWVFFVLPLVGIDLPAVTSAILVLGLNIGAYGAEAVRGAVGAISRDQWEAAVALQLSRTRTWYRVILPQAAPLVMAPATNLLIELLKATALVSLISIADLTFVAQTIRADTLRTAEVFTMTLLLYFGVASVLSYGMRYLERHLARWRDGTPT